MEIAAFVISLVGIATSVGTVIVNLVFRRLHEKDLAQLKQDQEKELELLKGQIVRDLKDHESLVRVSAEIQLRLIEQELESYADTRRWVRGVSRALAELAVRVQNYGAAPATADKVKAGIQLVNEALRADPGVIIPDELFVEFDAYMKTAREIAARTAQVSQLRSATERVKAISELHEALPYEQALRSRRIFRRWYARIAAQQAAVVRHPGAPLPKIRVPDEADLRVEVGTELEPETEAATPASQATSVS